MLLKSKPHFVRCRELQSQVSIDISKCHLCQPRSMHSRSWHDAEGGAFDLSCFFSLHFVSGLGQNARSSAGAERETRGNLAQQPHECKKFNEIRSRQGLFAHYKVKEDVSQSKQITPCRFRTDFASVYVSPLDLQACHLYLLLSTLYGGYLHLPTPTSSGRFIFASWKCLMENSSTLRKRFQRVSAPKYEVISQRASLDANEYVFKPLSDG